MICETQCKIAKAVGIDEPSCINCLWLGHEEDGSDTEYAPSYEICTKQGNENYNNLKTFPFKNVLSCWTPEFWCSVFCESVSSSEDVNKAYVLFTKAIDRAG
jgi:hypothetical protein